MNASVLPTPSSVVPTEEPVAGVAEVQPEPARTPPELKKLFAQLVSGIPAQERRAAKTLYRKHRNDPAILEPVSAALLRGFADDLDNNHHVDAMAWLCNILGATGNPDYAATLKTVLNRSRSRKIKGYAKKNLDLHK